MTTINTTSRKNVQDQTVIVGKVERVKGAAVTIDPSISLETAKDLIELQIKQENQFVTHSMDFDNNPIEVAAAFTKALEEVAGIVMGASTRSMFGETPPVMLTVAISETETISLHWGRLVFPFEPSERSMLHIGYTMLDTGAVGQISGTFRQKYMPVWEQLVTATRRHLEESIFKGKTLRLRFKDNSGDLLALVDIKPWNVQRASAAKLVFPRNVEQQIEDNIYTPILMPELCEALGEPFKRGVLLAGPYGTGKTELAAVVAKIGASKGITVLYLEDVRELPDCVRFACRMGGKVIIFAEDIDRIASGARTHEIDTLLNTLDGIDTKRFPIMTIVTSNYPRKIYAGMVRPGRIDVALEIPLPDAEACVRLVQTYLGEYFYNNGETEMMGAHLAELKMIPAIIHEVCKRSKLSFISRTKRLPQTNEITVEDVLRAAGSMKSQMLLLNPGETTTATTGAQLGTFLDKIMSENFLKVNQIDKL